MQRESIARMQARIVSAFNTHDVRMQILEDYTHTFKALGLGEKEAHDLAFRICCDLLAVNDIEKTEKMIHWMLSLKKVDGRNLIEILDEHLAGRAEIIFNQVADHLKFIRGPVIDFGCGDGQVTQLLKDRHGMDICGYDVRDYRAPGVTIPIHGFNGSHIDLPDGYFSAGLMTNVAHHEEHNQNVLDELTRLICRDGRLVVIETVPAEDSPFDFEITFLNDLLYNRFFHNADVPVPGTYETTEGWIRRFAAAGWSIQEMHDLGYDQPTIRDMHVLLVLHKR